MVTQSSHVDRIVETLLQMYLDLPVDGDAQNIALLEMALRSPAFTHLYNNYSNQSVKPLLRPLRGQPGNPNRRAQREVLNPDLMRLHVLLPPRFDHEDPVDRQMRGWLRELVYTSSNHDEDNDWGPFKTDGTVNWSVVDAVGSVMSGSLSLVQRNTCLSITKAVADQIVSNAKDVLAMGEDAWRLSLQPLSYGLDALRGTGYRDLSRPADLPPGEVWDWAGVEGEWCGSYAFLE